MKTLQVPNDRLHWSFKKTCVDRQINIKEGTEEALRDFIKKHADEENKVNA